MNKIIILFSLLGFLASCNSNEVDKALEVPTRDLLIRNKWKLVGYTQTPAYNGVTDVYAKMDECSKDNLFVFKADGSYSVDAGINKCSESELQTIGTGTWEFYKHLNLEDGENDLILKADGKATYYYIELITDSRLKLSMQLDEGGKKYTILQTFRNVK